jgi:hypothetical protein
MIAEIICACFAAAILITLIVIIIKGWKETHIPWVPFPEYKQGTFQCFEKNGSKEQILALAEAMHVAEDCLSICTSWRKENINKATDGIHIHVKSIEDWFVHLKSQEPIRIVAGLQMDDGIEVGPSFDALCHELAHRYLQVIIGDQNANHVDWDKLGIYHAIDTFSITKKK